MATLRVLFVEDSEDDALLVVRELRRAGHEPEFERVETRPDLEAALDRGSWDLVIGDYSMPEFSGTAALRVVRDRGLDVPFIFVSGTMGEDVAVAAMRAGASDYVVKGRVKRLVPAVERELREAAVRRERRRLELELRQAQRMEAVGRLAGGVAHDFNNLLTVILGYCDLLAEEGVSGLAPAPVIAEIKRAGESAAGLTRQLLAFSRRQVLQTERLDLSALVARLEPLLRRLLGEDVDLQTRLAPAGAAAVVADPGQLEQVIVNLAVNARDAMPTGGRLSLSTTVVELAEASLPIEAAGRPGTYALLAVTDTGIGMDEETRANIFEPFFTTKEASGGTGLGLATVYGIVAQSGGVIRVDSEPGRGTTFHVYLPVAEEGDDGEEDPRPPAADVGPRRCDETILVVEDAPAVRTVARRILEAQGYRVIEAADGAAAQRLAGQHEQIDLVLTDVVMPGMSGRDLARWFQEMRPGIKVLFTSGYTSDTVVRHGVVEGGLEFLVKPFTARTLSEKVRKMLDG